MSAGTKRRKAEPGRVLTLETLRERGACGDARADFRKRWGKQAVIDQQWARDAAVALPYCDDARWAAEMLLPAGWAGIYATIADDFSIWTSEGVRVRWAIFAALYVEAGKP